MNEMMKIWAREDRDVFELTYPAMIEPAMDAIHHEPDKAGLNAIQAHEDSMPECDLESIWLSGLIGYTVKLVNAKGKKFTGRLAYNRNRSMFDIGGKNSGMTVVNGNGKEWRFDRDEITSKRWIDLNNGLKRMEITYNG